MTGNSSRRIALRTTRLLSQPTRPSSPPTRACSRRTSSRSRPILAPLLLVGLLLLEVRLEHALVGGELGLVGCDSSLVVRSAILRELLPVIDDLLVRSLHLRLVGLHVRAVLLDLRFVARDLLIGRIVVVRARGRTDQEQSRRDSTHQVPDHVLPPRPSCQPHLPRRTRHPTRALTTRPCAPSADERRHRCARVGGTPRFAHSHRLVAAFHRSHARR